MHSPARYLLTVLLALAAGSGSQSADAQTSRPADTLDVSDHVRAHEPYDEWPRERLTGDWGGLRTDLEDAGVIFKLRAQNQYQQNFRGGLQTHHGHRFSGSYDLSLSFDLEKMNLIKGGSLYIKAKGNYSDGINPDKVGALNNTNADAVDDIPIYVRKWWYRQTLFDGKLDVLAGRYSTRKGVIDFSLYARHEDYDFLNQSSVRNATIPHHNGIGAFVTAKPIDWFYFTAAGIDGQAGRTRTGFDTAFHDDPRYVGYWEAGFTPDWASAKGHMPGKYRFGFWYDGTPHTESASDEESTTQTGDMGLYVGLDQMVFKEQDDPHDKQGLGLFVRYGHAPVDTSQISDYWQAGASYQGLVSGRDKDVFGVSVSQSILSSDYRKYVDSRADRETVYEWYYKFVVTPWFNVSPDFQVITNPGGGKDDSDSIVGGVRVQVIF